MKTILMTVVLLVCVQVVSAAQYQVTDLGHGDNIAMNSNGWVTWYGGSGYGSLLYKNGETVNVNSSVPHGISDSGIVVGSGGSGFMWQNNQTTILPFTPTSVNIDGTVVGNGYFYQNGVATRLTSMFNGSYINQTISANAVNNNSTVVGYNSGTPSDGSPSVIVQKAVAWFGTASSPTDLGAGDGSSAVALSSDNRIIGSGWNTQQGAGGSWLWQNGSLQWLGQTPEGRPFRATSVNADGQVLGISADIYGNGILELWQDNVFTNLGVLPVGTNGCFNYSEAVLNDSGQIAAICRVGSVPNSGPYEAVLISEVPEPATLGLLGFGLIALLRRRRI